MDAAHIAACSFDAWYPSFRDVTFDSTVLPLPPGLADFLVQDGVFLPPTSAALPRRSKVDEYAVEGVDYTEWSSDDEDDEAAAGAGQFKQFLEAVNSAIAQLGGKVLPKLNWSAPKVTLPVLPPRVFAIIGTTFSAAGIAVGVIIPIHETLRLQDAAWVLLLLQSSDRIAHDICHAFDGCTHQSATPAASVTVTSSAGSSATTTLQSPSDAATHPTDWQQGTAAATGDDAAATPAMLPPAHEGREDLHAQQGGASAPARQPRHVLVLRAWRELRPGREFRCFVHGREVVGISQRDMTQRFGFLAAEKEELQEALLDFHEDHVMAGFPLLDYTYDVYVTARGTVKLIDFNPVGGTTSPLLFGDWAALGYDFGAAAELHSQPAAPSAAGAGASAGPGVEPSAAPTLTQPETGAHVPPGPSPHNGSANSSMPSSPAAEEAAGRLAVASLEDCFAPGAIPGGSSSRIEDGSGHANGSSQHDGGSVHSAGNGSSSNCGPLQLEEVDFRTIDEPVVMRSAAQGYAVPYDFVDSSVTGALADFVSQARAAGS